MKHRLLQDSVCFGAGGGGGAEIGGGPHIASTPEAAAIVSAPTFLQIHPPFFIH